MIIDLHPDCTDLLVSANSILAIVLVVLQTVVIVMCAASTYTKAVTFIISGFPA